MPSPKLADVICAASKHRPGPHRKIICSIRQEAVRIDNKFVPNSQLSPPKCRAKPAVCFDRWHLKSRANWSLPNAVDAEYHHAVCARTYKPLDCSSEYQFGKALGVFRGHL